jgi:tetratricopeptide (TPR) repeat protein
MRPGPGDQSFGLRTDGPIFSPFEANAVDQARFQIASLLVDQKKYEDAIGELLRTAEESPDQTASGAAHLSIGNIFRHGLKDTDKAVEQYREVKGRLAELATRLIVDTYQEAGKPEEAIKTLDQLLTATQEPGQKIRLLNMTADVYRRSGKPEKAVETLRKITESLSYDDAEAMRRGWMEEEAQLGRMQDRIQGLRADGRNEEAERLQKEADEIKARKQMREALKNQKRAEPAPAKPEPEPKKEPK